MEILYNISQITNSSINIEDLKFYGVKLGEQMNLIPNEIIVAGPYANWYHTDVGFTFRIDSEDVIVEFLIKENILAQLAINQKTQIESNFGRAKSIEHKRGLSYYFYPEIRMVVTWKNESSNLFCIYIGDNSIKQTTYTISDFLDKYFELKSMVPDSRSWTEQSLKGNEPRFVRFQILKSLLRAYGLGDDLKTDFTNYGFVKNIKQEALTKIKEDIKQYALSNERLKDTWEFNAPRLNSPRMYQMIIQQFMRFLEQVDSLLKFNGGWLEASIITSQYSIEKINNVLKTIDTDQIKNIKELLCNLLDHQQREFTKSELIENYGFPNVDLEMIDMDNY